MKRILTGTILSLGLIAFAPSSHADGYQIAKANDCFKCHDISQEKKARPFNTSATRIKVEVTPPVESKTRFATVLRFTVFGKKCLRTPI